MANLSKNQEIAETFLKRKKVMATNVQTKKNVKMQLLRELDELIMEGWSEDMDLGTLLDSMPGDLREFFLSLKFDTPSFDGDGFGINFKI